MHISQIQELEVIDVSEGTRLGFVKDVEISLRDGRITAIMIENQSARRIFSKADDLLIPMEQVVKLGEDFIFIDLKKSQIRVEE